MVKDDNIWRIKIETRLIAFLNKKTNKIKEKVKHVSYYRFI